MVCKEDAYLYYNDWCDGGWMTGYALDLKDDCEMKAVTCPSFKSAADQDGIKTNSTVTLRVGEMCTISVDATEFVAHVYF